jgi:hypothetical protein
MSWSMPCGHDAHRMSGLRLPRWFSLAGLVCAALLNGGCGTTGPLEWIRNGFKVGPNYCRPPAPVAQEWIEAKDPRALGPPPRDGDWWEVFQDPTLTSAPSAPGSCRRGGSRGSRWATSSRRPRK